MKVAIIATVIGTVLATIMQDALKYIWQLLKNGYVARKQKRNDKKEINKKIEYIEKKQDEEWKYHNSRISKVLEQFENFKYNWKAKIPNSCSRIEFLCEYIELLEGDLTDEQIIKLSSIQSQVIELYNDLLKTNSVSKKEKRLYAELLGKLNYY